MSRGVLMHQSLREHCPSFHLYIFAFDDICAEALKKMDLTDASVITLSEFEDPGLLAVKASRSKGEYCWTSTSSTILYCLEKFDLPNCTYLDADLFFYNDPGILIKEKPADKHVIITEHRYTKYYDQSRVSGKYCVQFMYFDRSSESMEVLRWWRERCLEWCYNRIEDGKFGDQKYLDDWTTRFSFVWELKHLGGGLAPWNIQQYKFDRQGSSLRGTESQSGKVFEPVFFHFHGVKLYRNGGVVLAPNTYRISKEIRQLFYDDYLYRLGLCSSEISRFDAGFDPDGKQPAEKYLKDRYLKGIWGFIRCNIIKRIFG